MKKYILLAAILSLKIGGELRANNPYDTAIAVLQASVMPTKVGCGSIQGNYYIQNCNGGVSDSVVFPASQNYRFDFTGKGTQVSEVWPTMDIMIDGVTAASIVVNNAQPSIWTALINVTSGKHKVTMQFTNDNGLSTFKIFMALLYIFPNTKSISNVPVSYSLITKQALPSYGSGVLNSNHFMSGHLRGWNSGSIIRKNQTISPKDFADFKNYGANLLRAFVTLQSNGSTYSFTSHAIDSLDVFIQRARANKIYLDVVITDSNTTEQFWGSTSLKNSYIDRCREVAARYKDSIEIACYSLGNEPTSTGNLGEYAMFAQTITAAIRSIDATRTIVFPFMTGVSTDVFNLTEPLAFDNVVYELHFYLPFHITHQGINPGDSVRTEYPNSPSSPYYNPSYLGSYDSTNMKKEPLILNLKSFSDKYNVPVLVSEFDCIDWSPNWSANRWLSDAINIFEKYGWSWCNHAYRQYEGWNNEIPQDKWYGFTFTNAKPNVSNIRQLDQYETDTTLQVILLKKYFALNVDSSSTSLHTFYHDNDGDGYGNNVDSIHTETPLQGYVLNNTDCDDTDANVHPGATEICDGKDNDCNGQIDEGVTNTFYADADEDGYGNAAISVQACSAPAGYVASNTDCNDTDANIHPGAAEICDGKDNNCNGQTDEGVTSTFYADADKDGYGNPAISVQACLAPAGYVSNNKDCNDNDPAINPAAVEVCSNKIDDNCNGRVDEQPCYVCQNATGFSTTNITCNSAKLNWGSIPNPVQWKVQYKINAKGTSWIDFSSLLTGNIRSVTINSLLSNQEYLWRIRAKCGKTWTTYSNSILFKTSASCSGSVIASAASVITSAVSNNEVGNLILKLYPNPTKGQFVVEMHLADKINAKTKIQLIDMTGKTIQSENAEVNKGSLQKIISLSPAVTKGIYLVRIIVNDKIYKTEVIYSK